VRDHREVPGVSEFDPTSERHFPLLIIKTVEPKCTTELQIEVCDSGEVIRLTTTDDSDFDNAVFEAEVLDAWRSAWAARIDRRKS
jgi:hypothetical protein